MQDMTGSCRTFGSSGTSRDHPDGVIRRRDTRPDWARAWSRDARGEILLLLLLKSSTAFRAPEKRRAATRAGGAQEIASFQFPPSSR